MTSEPHRRRRQGSARGYEPGVLSVAEREAGLAFAAADAADLAAEWAEMSVPEQARYLTVHGDGGACDLTAPSQDAQAGDDADGDDAAAAAFRVLESGWLALAADGAAGVTDRELWAIATATPGTLGEPDRYADPRDGITQLRSLDRLAARLASQRHAPLAAASSVDAVGL